MWLTQRQYQWNQHSLLVFKQKWAISLWYAPQRLLSVWARVLPFPWACFLLAVRNPHHAGSRAQAALFGMSRFWYSGIAHTLRALLRFCCFLVLSLAEIHWEPIMCPPPYRIRPWHLHYGLGWSLKRLCPEWQTLNDGRNWMQICPLQI